MFKYGARSALLTSDKQVYRSLCPGKAIPHPRFATLRKLYDPRALQAKERILDSSSLVLYFPAPQTATGEDILELHVHGGPAIVKAILEAIPHCGGSPSPQRTTIRYAEPGEFTKRAFYNGRLDLTQAEALGDTLSAETEQQRRLAVSGAGGILAVRYEEWRKMLLYARGELEALIDFSEDQHFDETPRELTESITTQVFALKRQVELHVQNASKGELLRNGISVALLGAPNAGKSSLLNRIVGREAAIVSQEEGTTRDIVDVSVDIGGWLVQLGDMAGLRNKHSPRDKLGPKIEIGLVEKEGMRRAKARALESDVVVVVLSVETVQIGSRIFTHPHMEAEVLAAVEECQQAGKAIVVALNKIDKIHDNEAANARQTRRRMIAAVRENLPGIPAENIFDISCHPTGTVLASSNNTPDPGNIQAFLKGLTNFFSTLTTPFGDPVETAPSSTYWSHSLSVTHRQCTYLEQTLLHLDDYLSLLQAIPQDQFHTDGHDDLVKDVEVEVDIVAAAEHLRFAAECLSKITGKGESGDVEDVLGVVFEK